MKTGLPACEGRGPQLSAAMVDIAIRKCPMVIIAGEEKMYLIAFGDGSLLLAAEEFIADALQMIGDIAQAI
ncbi:MAG: hypothetical protein WCP91_04145, partial [Candidatus Berkelbacteria bacterium]